MINVIIYKMLAIFLMTCSNFSFLLILSFLYTYSDYNIVNKLDFITLIATSVFHIFISKTIIILFYWYECTNILCFSIAYYVSFSKHAIIVYWYIYFNWYSHSLYQLYCKVIIINAANNTLHLLLQIATLVAITMK